MDNTNKALTSLTALGFGPEEAKIYLELLSGPSTHLQLSRTTGINRTKVYRLVEQLKNRSLVGLRADDRGTFLVAADPATLEVAVVEREERLMHERDTLARLIPQLARLQDNDAHAFIVRTYEDDSGMKQMLWHELKTKDEIVCLGNGTVEQQSSDNRWSMAHRKRQLAKGYKTRELINYDYSNNTFPELASNMLTSAKLYDYRVLSPKIVTFDSQTVVYNDTVAIYNWKHGKKVGTEIVSPPYAHMMRQIFNNLWQLAGK